jgi:hypothetical protein
MENPDLDEGAFQRLDPGTTGAFLSISDATSDVQRQYASAGFRDGAGQQRVVRVVPLRAGTRLFKLTRYPEQLERDTLSPWWSSASPFEEADLGAREVFETALLNGVTMREFVRFVSAVSLDWNLLAWYVEVTLSTDVKAYWGQFAPQQGAHGPARDATVEYRDGPGGAESWVRYDGASQSDSGVYLPDVLGGFGAWQAYLPAFATRYVVPSKVTNIPATDNAALAAHFGVSAHRLAELLDRSRRA